MTLGQRKLEAANELARIYHYLCDTNQFASAELIASTFYAVTKIYLYDFTRPWSSTYITTPARDQGEWVPACNGTEVPLTTRTGRRLLYCWQPLTGDHAYIDLATDMALSYDEAAEALGGQR